MAVPNRVCIFQSLNHLSEEVPRILLSKATSLWYEIKNAAFLSYFKAYEIYSFLFIRRAFVVELETMVQKLDDIFMF